MVEAFDWKFSTFDDPDLMKLRRAVLNFAFDFLMWNTNHPAAKAPYWLTICGPSECGKTYLIHQAVRFIQQFRIHPATADVAKNPNRRIYANFYEANHLVHDAIRNGGQDFALAKDSDLLAVDDLGTDSGREAAIDVLYRLLSWRSARGETPGRWTIITSNLSPEQIGTLYDPRLESRLRRNHNRTLELPKDLKPYFDRKP